MKIRKILILGSNGLVGSQLTNDLRKDSGFEIFSFTKKHLDIKNKKKLRNIVSKTKPDLIINAAAHTSLLEAEENPETSKNVNYIGVKNLISVIGNSNTILIHFSSDYVYDGKKNSSYIEKDLMNPLNKYGLFKSMADAQIINSNINFIIFRTSWVFGKSKNNFPTKILDLAKTSEKINAVINEISTPTSSKFISSYVIKCIKKIHKLNNYQNIFNLVPNGQASRYDFAVEVLRVAEQKKYNLKSKYSDVMPVDNFPNDKIKRPKLTALNNDKIKKNFNFKFRDWSFYIKDLFIQL